MLGKASSPFWPTLLNRALMFCVPVDELSIIRKFIDVMEIEGSVVRRFLVMSLTLMVSKSFSLSNRVALS